MSVAEAATAEELEVDRRIDELLAAHDPRTEDPVDFLGAQFDAGLGWVHFPPGHGGLGLAPGVQRRIDVRLAAAGAPSSFERNILGFGMAGPTVVAHGTEEQMTRFLRPLFTGEEIWCQLFSEPGAGSDFASLATRAVRDGDEWVVNGQKVWTTLAHISRRGMLVARTDPNVAKHKGLTYFLVDMASEGVDVRPLRQMTGDAEFNEVYFTDVRIPDADRLGDVGQGWGVALTTLMNERVSLGFSMPKGGGALGTALDLWRARSDQTSPAARALRDRLLGLYVEAEVVRVTGERALENLARGVPGPEGATGKLFLAELNQRLSDLCVDLMGPEGTLYGSYEMVRPEHAMHAETTQKAFLRSRANTIEGGTSEIMRNILGERVLGLPGDVRVDRDKPWSEIPRS